MTAQRLTLTGIRVEGPASPVASAEFQAGLNVIVGASDTGKTYIANTLDFLLGATEPPPDNPQSRGYVRAHLGLLAGNKTYTISRDFRESTVQIQDEPLGNANPPPAIKQVSAIHRAGSTESLSHFLLSLVGLDGHMICRTQYAEKAALTMRHVVHLSLIPEEKIISKASPALSGDFVTAPMERSIFSFFLTGIDDTELAVIERPKERNARLETEEAVLRSILDAKEMSLNKLVGTERDTETRLKRIDASIGEVIQFVSATRDEIAAFEKKRKAYWEDLQRCKSRKLFVGEQLKRLDLLSQFYETDRKRLEAVVEAGKSFEQLPGGRCAVCGSKPEESNIVTSLGEFNVACTRELHKLTGLTKELQVAVFDMKEEGYSVDAAIAKAEAGIAETEQNLREKLKPQSNRADTSLLDLIRLKGDVAKALDLQAEIANLKKRLSDIESARKAKKQKAISTGHIGTAKAARFCTVVQETLDAWKCPVKGNVSFDADPRRFDLVIGDQNRGSMGKGYRAITHAAFVIGLMRYCRRENIPHPGFVILDTPLNPFKGPDEGPAGKVNDEIKKAFYEDLARDASGDQFIILENTEPPQHLIPAIRYHHFSKNSQTGRYGFFPISS